MDPHLAALLGLDLNQAPTIGQLAQVLAGNQADGGRILASKCNGPRRAWRKIMASMGRGYLRRRGSTRCWPSNVLPAKLCLKLASASLRSRYFALYSVFEGQ